MNSMPPGHVPGEILEDRYRVGEVIGRGGHGVVYRGYDLVDARPVAIKFLHPEFAKDPELNVRMLREAQVAAKLAGTAAIQIYALRSDHHRALFIVMELLEGHDLNEYLTQWEQQGFRLPFVAIPGLFDPIARTLDAAHAMKIVHRDLKPGNIYVERTPTGLRVRLLDFGLAKVMSASPLTRTGMVAGSPSYIAPEVWGGDSTKIDHRIDCYSLGALMFRAIAGQPPFVGNLIELMQASLSAPRPSLRALRPECDPSVDQWVRRALAIDPNQRYSTALETVDALRAALGV